MSRIKKKCFTASIIGHILLLALILVGPILMKAEEEEILDLPIINYVSDEVVAQALYVPPVVESLSEVVVEPDPVVIPELEPEPVPVVKEETKPEPQVVEKKEPEPVKVVEPEKPAWQATPSSSISVSGTRTTQERTQPKVQPNRNSETQKQMDAVLNNLTRNLSNSADVTTVSSNITYANYEQSVADHYKRSVTPLVGNNASVGVVAIRVVVRRDGTITQSGIITKSGQSILDEAVLKVLNSVKKVSRFPAGIKEDRWTIEIALNFEMK